MRQQQSPPRLAEPLLLVYAQRDGGLVNALPESVANAFHLGAKRLKISVGSIAIRGWPITQGWSGRARAAELRQAAEIPSATDGGLHMHQSSILMHMRTTLNLDDELVREAREVTGIQEKTALIHAALRELTAREAARRLAALGGSMPEARAGRRRRPHTR